MGVDEVPNVSKVLGLEQRAHHPKWITSTVAVGLQCARGEVDVSPRAKEQTR